MNKDEPTVRYVLKIGNEMFERDSFLAYRPDPEAKFPVLGIMFICTNKQPPQSAQEPVFGTISERYYREAVEKNRTTLTSNGFMQLSSEEVKEINNQYFSEDLPVESTEAA